MLVAHADLVLDDWIVRPQRSCIERGGTVVYVKPKSMAVLERLADADGTVVSRNALLDTVWRGGIVSDGALTQCVVELRKAFGDSARDGKIIETIPKKGLRLMPEAGPLPDDVGAAADTNAGLPFVQVRSGARHARNILLAVSLLAVIAVALWLLPMVKTPSTAGDADSTKSIAVQPFVDMSPEGDHVLEGSVRKSNDRLRITTQLIDVRSGFHLWSKTFDRSLDDVFAIQEEVAQSVATAPSVRLGVGWIGTLEGGTTKVSAFDEVLLGNAAYRLFASESILQAIEHFRRASRIDAGFALAWERLADVCRNAWPVLGSEDIDDFLEKSEEALTRAIALAPRGPRHTQNQVFLHLNRNE